MLKSLLSANQISGQFVVREHLPKGDYDATKKRLIPIVNQLLVATWTIVEVYLKAKFEELLRHKYAGSDSHLIDLVLKDVNVHTFDRLKDKYVDYLSIFLTEYDLDTIFETRNRTIDSKKTSWERIRLIQEVRNDIAHNGTQTILGELYPSDLWGLFEFVRNWITSFDTNFNILFYEKRSTTVIKEYQQRVADLAKLKSRTDL